MNLKKLGRYLQVNLLGPGPRLIKKKKNLPGRALTKVEKHWSRQYYESGAVATIPPTHPPVRWVGDPFPELEANHSPPS